MHLLYEFGNNQIVKNSLFQSLYGLLILAVFSISANAEEIQFGHVINPASPAYLKNALPLSTLQPPHELAKGAKVILVSGYSYPVQSNNKIKVIVNHPNSKVLLILLSYEKIIWEIESSPQTTITGILVFAARGTPAVVTTAKTTGYLVASSFYEEYSPNFSIDFKKLFPQLNQWFGISRIDALYNEYYLVSPIRTSDFKPFNAKLPAPQPDSYDTETAADSVNPPEIRFDEKQLHNVVPLLQKTPPRKLAKNTEVILISGYTAANLRKTGNKIKVIINRPKSKVLLVLAGLEKLVWEVESSPQTEIAGILVSGEQPLITTQIKTTSYFVEKLYSSRKIDSLNFKKQLIQLNQWFDIGKVDVYRGYSEIPAQLTISSLDAPSPQLTLKGMPLQQPPVNFTFRLIKADDKTSQWSLLGINQKQPKTADTKVIYNDSNFLNNSACAVLSGDRKTLYKLADEKLKSVDISKQPYAAIPVAPLPINFYDFSQTKSIAYDTKRNIVTLVSFSGEGFLYRFDAVTKKWLDYRLLNNTDITSLSYDAITDRYVAWSWGGELVFISAQGEALFKENLIDKLSEFGRIYDSDNGTVPKITLVPHGDDIGILYIADETVKKIWYYNLKTKQALLTYRYRSKVGN